MRVSTVAAILGLAAGLASSVALPLPAMKFGRAPQKVVRDNSLSLLQAPEGPPPPPPPPGCPPPPPPGCPPHPPPHNLNAPPPPPDDPPPPPPDNPPPPPSDNPPPASFENPPPASSMRHVNFFMLNKPTIPIQGTARSAVVDRMNDQPNSRRELLERFDQVIKLASRVYGRELLTTHMDDLD